MSGVYTRLDSICMSESERCSAEASLRDGELIAALVLRAADTVRGLAQSLALAASTLASGIKSTLTKPVKH
jgi:hypothetical protein